MKLEKKIYLYLVVLITIILLVTHVIFFQTRVELENNTEKNNLTNIAFTLSQDPFIIENLYEKNSEGIQRYTSKIWSTLEGVDFITVANMEGKRYSHKEPKYIGKKFKGGDQIRVVSKGESYFSIAKGTQGVSLRKFVPIYRNGKQIGFISVGKFQVKRDEWKNNFIIKSIMLFFIILSFGAFLAYVLAKSIKKEIFGYEPVELGRIYSEKKAIFDNMHEGIITVNKNGEIQKTNIAARNMLVEKDDEIFIKLFNDVVEANEGFKEREIMISSGKIFVSAIKLNKKKKTLDVIFILRDGGEVKRIAREITGVSQIINTMRANVHEFKNKIHVVSGLLQIGEYEEAKNYILYLEDDVENQRYSIVGVKDPIIEALILAKISLAREYMVNLIVDENSKLHKEHGRIDSNDLVVIIGNLLENAREACEKSEEKNILIKFFEDSEKIIIEVTDSGKSIDTNEMEKIFNMGYSSKGKGRGSGLALIKNLVEVYGGNFNIKSRKNSKTFYVELKKG
jgi:two-component system CitB family sensor kinase